MYSDTPLAEGETLKKVRRMQEDVGDRAWRLTGRAVAPEDEPLKEDTLRFRMDAQKHKVIMLPSTRRPPRELRQQRAEAYLEHAKAREKRKRDASLPASPVASSSSSGSVSSDVEME